MGLKQVFAILWARRWLVLAAWFATIGAAVAAVLVLPPRYEATATVMLDGGEADPITGQLSAVSLLRVQQRSQIAVLESLRTALDVVKRLQLTRSAEFQSSWREATGGQGDLALYVARALLKGIEARPVVESGTETNMMSITYTSPDPQFSALVANTFLDAFLAESLELKTSPMVRDAQWYAVQNVKLREDLENARAQLSKFQRDNDIVGRSDAFDVESARLRSLGDQIVQANGQLTADQSTLKELRALWPDSAPPPLNILLPPGADNPSIEKIRDSLTSTMTDIARQSKQLGANHPTIKALESTEADLRVQLAREMVTARDALISRFAGEQTQLALLQSQYKDETAKVLALQTQRDQLDILQKDVAQKQALLDNAEERASAVKLQGQRSSLNILPIDSAVPSDSPSFPKKIIILPLSFGLGLMLGISLALLREALDRRVRVPSDVELATGFEVLGEILPAPPRGARRWLIGRRKPVALLPAPVKG